MQDSYFVRKPVFTPDKQIFAYIVAYKNRTPEDVEGKTRGKGEDMYLTVLEVMDHSRIYGDYFCFSPFHNNFPWDYLGEKLFKEKTIIEIFFDDFADSSYFAKVTAVKGMGYTIMLRVDNMVQAEVVPIDMVDVIAVNLGSDDKKMESRLCMWAKDRGKLLLGLNIDNAQEFLRARRLRSDLMEGNFYKISECPEAAPTLYPLQVSFLRLMQLQQQSDPEFEDYIKILNGDITISYRLLTHMNKLSNYRGNEITSIRSAAIALGIEQLKEWIYLACFQSPFYGKNDEIVRTSLLRANFFAQIRPYIHSEKLTADQYHLCGMLSLINAIMNTSMDRVVENLPVNVDIKDALSHRVGRLGVLINMVEAYERGDWETVSQLEEKLDIKKGAVVRTYLSVLSEGNIFWGSVTAMAPEEKVEL